MSELLGFFKSKAGRIGNFLSKLSNIFDSDDPIIIIPYRGYANDNQIFLKGRVIENEDIFQGKSEEELGTLDKSWRRFATDEIANAKIQIKVANQEFEVTTDDEGYFTLESEWNAPPKDAENEWLTASVTLVNSDVNNLTVVTADAEIYLPSRNADYGVITDVDDTILQSHVTSRFKLKMLYVTFFKDPSRRKPMEGMVKLFKAFVKGGNGKKENPIFYVSHGPWNIYDMLEQFLEMQAFPKGPLLLRDFGLNLTDAFKNHKVESITKILETFPDLPFVLLGDSAEKDADFYLTLLEKFPNQIKTIYIRRTSDSENALRIEKLIEEKSNANVVLARSSEEMLEHAKANGLMIA